MPLWQPSSTTGMLGMLGDGGRKERSTAKVSLRSPNHGVKKSRAKLSRMNPDGRHPRVLAIMYTRLCLPCNYKYALYSTALFNIWLLLHAILNFRLQTAQCVKKDEVSYDTVFRMHFRMCNSHWLSNSSYLKGEGSSLPTSCSSFSKHLVPTPRTKDFQERKINWSRIPMSLRD